MFCLDLMEGSKPSLKRVILDSVRTHSFTVEPRH